MQSATKVCCAQVLSHGLTMRRVLCSAAEPVSLDELIEWLSEVIILLDGGSVLWWWWSDASHSVLRRDPC